MPLPVWRDVAAPNFEGSMQGLSMFSQLLNQGLGTVQAGVAKLDQGKSDDVNKAIALRLAALNDPATAGAEAQQILAEADPNRISAASIAGIQARPGELQNQAVSNMKFQSTKRDFANNELWDAAFNGAAPELTAYDVARKSGDQKAIGIAEANLSSKLQALGAPAEKLFGFGSTIDQRSQAGFDRSQGYTNADRAKTRFDWDVTGHDQAQLAYKETQAAKEFAGQYRLAGFVDQDQAYRAIQGDLKSGKIPNGRVANMIATEMGLSALPDPSAGGDAGGVDFTGLVGGGGAGDPSRIMNYEAKASGFTAVPDSVKTLGQASDFALQVNEANKKRTGTAGSSAMGLYQIVGDTMRKAAPKVLGPNWRNEAFNPENQDKMARYIFESNNGSAAALRKQWVSLDPKTAEMVRRLPWEQARDIIARGESGITVPIANILGAQKTASVNTQLQSADMQQNFGNSIPKKFGELAAQNDLKPIDVAANIAKRYPGVNSTWAEGQIDEIMTYARKNGNGRNNMNAAIAGQIVMDNLKTRRGFFNTSLPESLRSDAVGGGKFIDMDAAKQAALGYVNGEMDSAIQNNAGRSTAAGQAQNYTAQISAKKNIIQQKIATARRRGGTPDIAQDLVELQQLNELAGQANEAVGSFTQAPDRRRVPEFIAPAPAQAPGFFAPSSALSSNRGSRPLAPNNAGPGPKAKNWWERY